MPSAFRALIINADLVQAGQLRQSLEVAGGVVLIVRAAGAAIDLTGSWHPDLVFVAAELTGALGLLGDLPVAPARIVVTSASEGIDVASLSRVLRMPATIEQVRALVADVQRSA